MVETKNETISQDFNRCPECGSATIDALEKGETVCKSCGLIIRDHLIDHSHSGIRAYTKREKEKKSRTGSPISVLVPDIGLATIIDPSEIKDQDLKRAAKWSTHLSWENRNMLIAITELKRIGSILNFPERVKKAAVKLYKKVFKRDLLRGRSIKGMITACAYYKCKKERIPITLQEILDESAINEKIIKKCFKVLVKELDLNTHNLDPVYLIPRFCADLGLPVKVEKDCVKILRDYYKNHNICGKDPKGFCAGVIYLVAKFKNIKISQKEIAQLVGVTEVTLRSRYKDLLKNLKLNY